MSTLKQRVITAVWLAAIFLAALLISPLATALLIVLVLVPASWEWAALAGQARRSLRLVYTLVQLALFVPFAYGAIAGGGTLPGDVPIEDCLRLLLSLGAITWLLALVAVVRFPAFPASLFGDKLVLVSGTPVLLAAVCSLLFLRLQPNGVLWILYCVAIVAAADIGAYFSGRRWGRHKLAPQLSPGKSWEGVVGGMLAALLVALVFYLAWARAILPGNSAMLLAFLGIALLQAASSVIGDLFESLLKRRVDVKDSGTLLPGHGGMLDRVDGLLASAPLLVFAFIALGW